MTSQEISRKLTEKRSELSALLDKYKTDDGYDVPSEHQKEVYDRQDELTALNEEYKRVGMAEVAAKNQEELANLNRLERRYVGAGSGNSQGGRIADTQGKSLGQLVTESWEYKNRKNSGMNGKFSAYIEGVDVKTLLTTAGSPGIVPANNRTDLVVPYANRRPMVSDLIPETTDSEVQIVKWLEQVTFTNNVSQIAEGGQKAESALDWDEKTVQLRKLAHWIPVTDEQVTFVPALMSLLDNDMSLMIRLQEEIQLLYGNGTGENLTGFLTHANLQSQAFDTNNADTIMKAMTKVSHTGFASPTAVIMHPNNWQTIRLLKDTDQGYVLGSPLVDVTPRLFGVPVIVTTAITAGTALVGDFILYAHIWRKNGIRVDVTDSHSDFFIYNKLVIRAEEYIALQIKRGAAYCQATSLT